MSSKLNSVNSTDQQTDYNDQIPSLDSDTQGHSEKISWELRNLTPTDVSVDNVRETSQSVVFSDGIVERHFLSDSSEVGSDTEESINETKHDLNTYGFPKAPRINNPKEMDSGKTSIHQTKDNYENENDEKLSKLNMSEILELQKELRTRFGDELCDALRSRKEKKLKSGASSSAKTEKKAITVMFSNSEGSGEWLPLGNLTDLEAAKLQWTNPCMPADSPEKNSVSKLKVPDFRFDFDGNSCLPWTCSPDSKLFNFLKKFVRDNDALYHHGDNASKPGYSIVEILHLISSTNHSQRKLMMRMLMNILSEFRKLVPEKLFEKNDEQDMQCILRSGFGQGFDLWQRYLCETQLLHWKLTLQLSTSVGEIQTLAAGALANLFIAQWNCAVWSRNQSFQQPPTRFYRVTHLASQTNCEESNCETSNVPILPNRYFNSAVSLLSPLNGFDWIADITSPASQIESNNQVQRQIILKQPSVLLWASCYRRAVHEETYDILVNVLKQVKCTNSLDVVHNQLVRIAESNQSKDDVTDGFDAYQLILWDDCVFHLLCQSKQHDFKLNSAVPEVAKIDIVDLLSNLLRLHENDPTMQRHLIRCALPLALHGPCVTRNYIVKHPTFVESIKAIIRKLIRSNRSETKLFVNFDEEYYLLIDILSLVRTTSTVGGRDVASTWVDDFVPLARKIIYEVISLSDDTKLDDLDFLNVLTSDDLDEPDNDILSRLFISDSKALLGCEIFRLLIIWSELDVFHEDISSLFELIDAFFRQFSEKLCHIISFPFKWRSRFLNAVCSHDGPLICQSINWLCSDVLFHMRCRSSLGDSVDDNCLQVDQLHSCLTASAFLPTLSRIYNCLISFCNESSDFEISLPSFPILKSFLTFFRVCLNASSNFSQEIDKSVSMAEKESMEKIEDNHDAAYLVDIVLRVRKCIQEIVVPVFSKSPHDGRAFIDRLCELQLQQLTFWTSDKSDVTPRHQKMDSIPFAEIAADFVNSARELGWFGRYFQIPHSTLSCNWLIETDVFPSLFKVSDFFRVVALLSEILRTVSDVILFPTPRCSLFTLAEVSHIDAVYFKNEIFLNPKSFVVQLGISFGEIALQIYKYQHTLVSNKQHDLCGDPNYVRTFPLSDCFSTYITDLCNLSSIIEGHSQLSTHNLQLNSICRLRMALGAVCSAASSISGEAALQLLLCTLRELSVQNKINMANRDLFESENISKLIRHVIITSCGTQFCGVCGSPIVSEITDYFRINQGKASCCPSYFSTNLMDCILASSLSVLPHLDNHRNTFLNANINLCFKLMLSEVTLEEVNGNTGHRDSSNISLLSYLITLHDDARFNVFTLICKAFINCPKKYDSSRYDNEFIAGIVPEFRPLLDGCLHSLCNLIDCKCQSRDSINFDILVKSTEAVTKKPITSEAKEFWSRAKQNVHTCRQWRVGTFECGVNSEESKIEKLTRLCEKLLVTFTEIGYADPLLARLVLSFVAREMPSACRRLVCNDDSARSIIIKVLRNSETDLRTFFDQSIEGLANLKDPTKAMPFYGCLCSYLNPPEDDPLVLKNLSSLTTSNLAPSVEVEDAPTFSLFLFWAVYHVKLLEEQKSVFQDPGLSR